MQTFVNLGRSQPPVREPEERRRDFQEILARFGLSKASEQASRCAQCGVPFCQIGCPVNNNIPDWLLLAAEGRYEEAYHASAATNTFPEICGRICPQDRLCEGACVIEQAGQGAITIGAVETFLTEMAFEEGWVLPIPKREATGKQVAIIGAGPAGLTAAEALVERGHSVTIYDRYDRAGGMMIYGIPNFKLEKSVVGRRIDRLQVAGIEFVLGAEIGKTVSFTELRKKHDAILIATGVYDARKLTVPGTDLIGVIPALRYLTAENKRDLNATPDADAELIARDQNVVVVGGGDTAMDCVRTAVRQGAKSVRCLYRRGRADMPGSAREVFYAEEEGVEFLWNVAPKAIENHNRSSSANSGPVNQVRLISVGPGSRGSSGRPTLRELEGTEHSIDADLVILALGYDPEALRTLWEVPELPVTKWGTVRVDPVSFETDFPGVFAAGDIVRGASLIVWAIAEGRKAAEGIHRCLKGSDAASAPTPDGSRKRKSSKRKLIEAA